MRKSWGMSNCKKKSWRHQLLQFGAVVCLHDFLDVRDFLCMISQKAKQIYFKSWDPHHNSYPNSSNLQRLREFVKDVYIDRRCASENSSNKQPLAQPESRSSFCEWPYEMTRWGRRDDYLGQSPPVERGRDHSLFERSSSDRELNFKDFLEERSPINNQVVMPRSSHRDRSTRFEISIFLGSEDKL